jgi:hypothetical protein
MSERRLYVSAEDHLKRPVAGVRLVLKDLTNHFKRELETGPTGEILVPLEQDISYDLVLSAGNGAFVRVPMPDGQGLEIEVTVDESRLARG